MNDTYILEGTIPVPVDWLTWAQWFGDANRQVADTWVTPTLRVSTVFLGLDHQLGDGPPLLFETMVFHEGEAREQARYHTWAEAAQGHLALVEQLRAQREESSHETSEACLPARLEGIQP